jgi:hypothetical protein
MSVAYFRSLRAVVPAALLALAVTASPARSQTSQTTSSPDYSRYIYPLAKPIKAPKFTIDVSDAPDQRPWAEEAVRLMTEWYPMICEMLDTSHYQSPKELKVVVKKGISAPAYTGGGVMTINADWISQHPDDFGMVIHELTHVVQAYHFRHTPGWLTEGIADYIRWWRYEPESPRTPVNPDKATYHDSYRTTANFLAWVVGRNHRTLVPRLDGALKAGTYSDDLWKEITGETVEELWADYVAYLRKGNKV